MFTYLDDFVVQIQNVSLSLVNVFPTILIIVTFHRSWILGDGHNIETYQS